MRSRGRDVGRPSNARLVLAMVIAFGAGSALTVPVADAVPKGPAGQTCKSSGTTSVKGKDEATGQAMNCTADYCKYDECETSGPDIGKCYEKTSYSNVRDCKPAAMKAPQSGIVPGQMAPLTVEPSQPPVRRTPMVPKGGVMQRGVEPDEPTSSEREGE